MGAVELAAIRGGRRHAGRPRVVAQRIGTGTGDAVDHSVPWLRRGWVQGRKLPGGRLGRWVLWADAPELDRLRRLRTCPRGWSDEPFPQELTRPRRRPES